MIQKFTLLAKIRYADALRTVRGQIKTSSFRHALNRANHITMEAAEADSSLQGPPVSIQITLRPAKIRAKA